MKPSLLKGGKLNKCVVKQQPHYLERVQELLRDINDLLEVPEEDSDVNGPLLQDLRGVQPKGLPGQLEVTAELPLRRDQLADHILPLLLVLFAVEKGKQKVGTNNILAI